jgi:hypothetical protein
MPELRALDRAIEALAEIPSPAWARREVRYDRLNPGQACSATFGFSDGSEATYLARSIDLPSLHERSVFGDLLRLESASMNDRGADAFHYAEFPPHGLEGDPRLPPTRRSVRWIPTWSRTARATRRQPERFETTGFLLHISPPHTSRMAPAIELSEGRVRLPYGNSDLPPSPTLEDLVRVGHMTGSNGGREPDYFNLDAADCIQQWVRGIAEALA